MDFEKICMMFTMQEPYYGILLSSMRKVEEPGMGTMGVGRSGNVLVLYYDRQWFERQPVDTALEALKHEVLHAAFNHFALFGDDHPSPEIQRLRNIAADMEVNSYINRQILSDEAKNSWQFADRYGWKNCEGTREYYTRLLDLAEQQAQQILAQNPQQQLNGGAGGQSTSTQKQQQADNANSEGGQGQGNNYDQICNDGSGRQLSKSFINSLNEQDDHSMWPRYYSDTEAEEMQQIIDDMLEFAAQEVEKSHGEIPAEMKGRIEKIREKPKPVTDWKRYFRRYLGHEFSEFIRKSKKRESMRFPDAAGTRHRRKSHILVGIDTSGSVSMPEYREFFGQIKTLTNAATFHVVECDARIQYEYDFNRNAPEILHGGGGTNFQPVIDMFNEHRKEYDALVYFTDGYSSIPRNTPKDTLWVISSQGDKNRKKYEVNGASVVFIPEKK